MGSSRRPSRKKRARSPQSSAPIGSEKAPSHVASSGVPPHHAVLRGRWLVGVLVVALGLLGFLAVRRVSDRWYERGLAALRIHDFEVANGCFEKAASWLARSGRSDLMRCRVAWVEGDVDKSLELLQIAEAHGVDPKRTERERELIQIRGGAAAAQRTRLPALLQQTTPEDGPAIMEAFVTGYLSQGSAGQANEILAIWEDAAPDDPRIEYWRGVLNRAFGDQENAIEHFKQALQKAPGMTPARLGFADLLRSSYFYPEALKEYERILQVHPTHADARVGIAICQLRSGAVEEGERQLISLINDDVQVITCRLALAEYYQDQQQSQQVLETVLPLLEAKTMEVNLHYLLSAAYFRLGELQRGQEEFDAFQRMKRQLETMQMLKSRYQTEPSAELAQQIARGLMECNWQEAGSWILETISRDPRNVEMHRLMAAYLRLAGRADAAESYEQTAHAMAAEATAPR